VLQNRCALDLLTAEKGGTCLFLNEECCFYTNKSGVVRDMARQLKERVTKRRQEPANSWSFWSNIWSWVPWALPLAGPLFMPLLILLFRPCIINAISRFISQQVQWIKLQLLGKEYSPLPTHEPSILFYRGLWRLHGSTPETKVPPPLPHVTPLPARIS
jgi:hypothetical protein